VIEWIAHRLNVLPQSDAIDPWREMDEETRRAHDEDEGENAIFPSYTSDWARVAWMSYFFEQRGLSAARRTDLYIPALRDMDSAQSLTHGRVFYQQ
jgi:hypothetical protein